MLRTLDGKGKERTRTVDLPEGTVVACSPAAAVRDRVRAGGTGNARVRLFDPADGSVRTVRVEPRGKAPFAGGGAAEALGFSLSEEGSRGRKKLWTDPEGRLLRLEDPGRGIAFRPAGREAKEKLGLRAVPNPVYVPVSAACEHPSRLTWLEVEARLEVSGVRDTEGLTTAWQTFRGKVRGGVAEGVFRVRAFVYGQSRPAPGPSGSGGPPPGPGDLGPGDGIPVDALEIRTLAARAAEGLKKRRHIAHALGLWMIRNLTFDPFGGEDAPAVLRMGRGDARGFARLYAALCRSLGIPCRITCGAKYVRAAGGGGFVAHTWNEVYLDEGKTWIPVDTASGHVSFFGAGHLCLGPGAAIRGGTAEVQAWIPREEKGAPSPAPVRSAEFPLAPGTSRTYARYVAGRRLGTERVTFAGVETREGRPVFRFRTETTLGAVTVRSETVASAEGGLLFHEVRRKDPVGEESVRTFEREGNKVRVRIVKGDETERREIALPPEGLFMDSDAVFLLGFLLSRLVVEEGDAVPVSLFHAGTLQVLEVQVACLGREPVSAAGKTVETRSFEVRSGFQCLYAWLDDRGLLVRESEQGGRAVALLEPPQ